jgi:hypothetical protein
MKHGLVLCVVKSMPCCNSCPANRTKINTFRLTVNALGLEKCGTCGTHTHVSAWQQDSVFGVDHADAARINSWTGSRLNLGCLLLLFILKYVIFSSTEIK